MSRTDNLLAAITADHLRLTQAIHDLAFAVAKRHQAPLAEMADCLRFSADVAELIDAAYTARGAGFIDDFEARLQDTQDKLYDLWHLLIDVASRAPGIVMGDMVNITIDPVTDALFDARHEEAAKWDHLDFDEYDPDDDGPTVPSSPPDIPF